jgi:hydrocephalus-inducing protein
VKTVVISNTGKVGFDFNWVFDGASVPPSQRAVTVTPLAGKVPANSQATCQLEFKPSDAMTVEGLKVKCEVAGTRSYRLSVSGSGSRPQVAFSANSVDFGPCFFPTSAGVTPQPEVRHLRITNNEREDDVSLECLFTKKAHLEVGFDAKVLRPGESVDVALSFYPRAAGVINETVLFEINGLYSIPVSVLGEGVPVRLALVNPSQETLAFGSFRVGQEAVRRVGITNRSKRAASFVLEDVIKDPTTGRGALESCFVEFSPREATLKPKETVVIEVRFAPPQRVPAFSETIMLKVAGDTSKLLTVTGACQGMEVKLDNDNLTFGPVRADGINCLWTRLRCSDVLYVFAGVFGFSHDEIRHASECWRHWHQVRVAAGRAGLRFDGCSRTRRCCTAFRSSL